MCSQGSVHYLHYQPLWNPRLPCKETHSGMLTEYRRVGNLPFLPLTMHTYSIFSSLCQHSDASRLMCHSRRWGHVWGNVVTMGHRLPLPPAGTYLNLFLRQLQGFYKLSPPLPPCRPTGSLSLTASISLTPATGSHSQVAFRFLVIQLRPKTEAVCRGNGRGGGKEDKKKNPPIK